MGKTIRAVIGVGLIVGSFFLPPGLNVLGMKVGAAMVAVGLTLASSALAPSPRIPRSQISRLNVSLDPNTARKAVLGTTAMPLDLRYHEASGTDQEFIDYIIALSAHKVASIDEIYFEEKLAWTAVGGVTATYTGYLTVTTITEGTGGNAAPVNAGAVWDASCRLTGCAYVRIRIKRTGNSKKTESPLVQGLPSRVTIIGEGALLYDPRLDSTVPGGSGSHRANDQATWGAYAGSDDYDNPALQLLWFLLGWKINGKLSVGAGVPPARIDLESFITAANICDEDITLAIGGTQKRYRTSGTVSDEDGRMDAINTFLACMNGTLRDSGGKLTLALLKNDLADPVLDFTDGDFLGEFAWDQTGGGLAQGHNIIRGKYVDPSTQSLYQMAEYPEVSLPSPDGIERVMTFDVPFVEDGRRAQRLAKQVLQRHQFRGQLSAEFNAKALGCEVGDIVTITLSALGFNEKPFRVISKEVRVDGRVPLALLEESSLIYQWDRDDRAPVVARTPVVYDPLLNMITQGDEAVQAIAEQALQDASDAISAAATAQATADGKVTTFYQSEPPTAEELGDLWIDTDDDRLYRWSGTAWIEIQDADIAQAIADAASAQATADGKIVSFYQNEPPTAGAVGDFWIDTNDSNKLYRWNGSAWQTARDAGIEAAISAAATAQSTADGKILTFYQDAPPGGGTLGDLWFDTNDSNKLYRHNGITFIEARDAGIAQAITDAAGAQATADGKVTTFYSASAPVAEGVGDLWFDTDDNILYRWNGTSWSDDVADITSATIPRHEPADSAATFTANYQGTLDVGQLPTNIQFRRFRGSTDVSTTSTWSIVSQSGITGATVTVSNGVVTIPTGVTIGSTGEIVVKSVRDSFEITSRVVITRIDAAPPNTGGSTGGTTVNDSTFNTVTGTSLTAISDLMTVKTGSGGQIVFSAPLSILATAADPEGTFGAIGRWRYRTVGGSFVDAGTQADDSQPCEIFYDLELDRYFRIAGSISIGATVTGLSANTDYEVQLFAARDSAPSAKTISFGGTASATGS
jgi:hypothetical protein